MSDEQQQLVSNVAELIDWFETVLVDRQLRSRSEYVNAADAFARRASLYESRDGETNFQRAWSSFERQDREARELGFMAALSHPFFPPRSDVPYEDHELGLIVGLAMAREASALVDSSSPTDLCAAALLIAEAREVRFDWCVRIGFSRCRVPDPSAQRIQKFLDEIAAEPFVRERARKNQGKGGTQAALNNARIQKAREKTRKILIDYLAGGEKYRRKSGRLDRTSLAMEVMRKCKAPTSVEKVRKWLREFEAELKQP